MKQSITCISCPFGCRMQVDVVDGQVQAVTGNNCGRGRIYAQQECIAPKRMLTAVVAVQGRSLPVSVKTQSPIPKEKIMACMHALRQLHLTAPITAGQILIDNVADTGISIIATKCVR